MNNCFSVPNVKEQPRLVQQTKRSSTIVLVMVLGAFLQLSVAQDDLFITVSAPAAGQTAAEKESNLFTTVSSVAEQPASTVQPAAQTAAGPARSPVDSHKESAEKWEQELLRDPLWPIGFFPEGWQKKTSAQGESDLDGSGWKAAADKIRISGTSRLGGRTAAIINGELKGVGDQIEVSHAGKTYQWLITGIDAEGRIQLKKEVIK
jgi:hypothetical protein